MTTMQTATLTWNDPVTKITGVEIAVRATGDLVATVVTIVAPGVETLVVPDLDNDTYVFTATSLNGDKRASGVSITVVVEDIPANVTDFAATLA